MRIVSGSTTEFLHFVAASTSDHISRVTGLTSFGVYAAATSASTGSTYGVTVNEVNSTQMPGVYRVMLTDSTLLTIPAGVDSREICLHITSSMDPVTRTFELYRRTATTGQTLTVDSSGAGNSDVKEFGGTSVTGRDIGASVLLSSGTGTGQVVLTAGNPTVLLSSGTGTGQVVLTAGNPTVLLSSGTGTGQIKLTGGQVDVAQFAGATLSTGTAHFGVNVVQINGVAASAVATINPILGTSQAVNFATTGSTAGIKADIQTIAGAAVSTATAHFGVNVVQAGGVAWASGSIVAGSFASGAIDATAIAANAIGASELAAGAANVIADAFLDRDMATGTDSGSTSVRTPRQALRFLRNKWAISGTTMSVYKEDDATASWTAVLTGTSGADPITAVDPA